MPYDYKIDLDDQVLLGRVWGVWTVQDVKEFRERIAYDPDFSVQMPQLVDLTEVTDVGMGVRDIVDLGADTPLGSQARRAYVAPASHVFGMLRAYQATADKTNTNTRIFRSKQAARAWLGLD